MALILEFVSGTSGRVQSPVNYKENEDPLPKKRSTSTHVPPVGNASSDLVDNNLEQPEVQLMGTPAADPHTSTPLLERGQRPPMVRRIQLFMLALSSLGFPLRSNFLS